MYKKNPIPVPVQTRHYPAAGELLHVKNTIADIKMVDRS